MRESTRAHALRAARTCYDHLAGRLGVAVTEALASTGVVHVAVDPDADPDPDPPVGHGHELTFTLTDRGRTWLADLGAGVPGSVRPGRPLRYCVDWSEQRPHVAGWFGRALLARMVELDWVTRAPRGRALRVTPDGRTGLRSALGLELP